VKWAATCRIVGHLGKFDLLPVYDRHAIVPVVKSSRSIATACALVFGLLPSLTMAVPDPQLMPFDTAVTLLLGVRDTTAYKRTFEKCASNSGAIEIDKLLTFSPCEILDDLLANSEPLTAHSFANVESQVIYFGETHIYPGAKRVLAGLLRTLKTAGVSHLALEMFNSSQQPALDRFLLGQLSLEDLGRELATAWSYETSPYLELLRAARESGIRIIAIDDRRPEAPGSTFAENFHARDLFMAEKIADLIRREPGARVVAFTGSLHAKCSLSRDGSFPSQSEMLRSKHGISTSCFPILERKRSGLVRMAYRASGLKGDVLFKAKREKYLSDGFVILE
jgi:hypothetical protein